MKPIDVLLKTTLEEHIENCLDSYCHYMGQQEIKQANKCLDKANKINITYSSQYGIDYASRYIINELAKDMESVKHLQDFFKINDMFDDMYEI